MANATAMVVLDAHRYGLAQLHQLRGRVGRGTARSYCILVYPDESGERERLEILTGSNDGFEIADEDLRLRGPGQSLRHDSVGRCRPSFRRSPARYRGLPRGKDRSRADRRGRSGPRDAPSTPACVRTSRRSPARARCWSRREGSCGLARIAPSMQSSLRQRMYFRRGRGYRVCLRRRPRARAASPTTTSGGRRLPTACASSSCEIRSLRSLRRCSTTRPVRTSSGYRGSRTRPST